MGTRNLTLVILDGKTKIAQYGQWDGYPAGQGKTALEFLQRQHKKDNYKAFKEVVSKLRWLTNAEAKKLDAQKDPYKKHPYLSRDVCAKILETVMTKVATDVIVYESKNYDRIDVPFDSVLGLVDETQFAGDSLFCEWAYVVDFDKETFEVYKGFNTRRLGKAQRFYPLQEKPTVGHSGNAYYPVRLLKKYFLSDLPKLEDFLLLGK